MGPDRGPPESPLHLRPRAQPPGLAGASPVGPGISAGASGSPPHARSHVRPGVGGGRSGPRAWGPTPQKRGAVRPAAARPRGSPTSPSLASDTRTVLPAAGAGVETPR